MEWRKMKTILNRMIGCLFVLTMASVFNMSVAQSSQIQSNQIQSNQIQSNEKKVVECTPIKTRRDVAFEQQQTGELQKAETKGQAENEGILEEADKSHTKSLVKRELLNTAETAPDKAKMEKKIEVIDDK